MVPLAVGSQTNGSVIRPASYCGIWEFKPTHGLVSRHGVLRQSRQLDHVGVFARTVEDIALLAEVLMAFDERDPDTRPHAWPKLLATVAEGPPVTPRLAFVKSPVWEEAEHEVHAAFTELIEHLGEVVEEVALPETFDHAVTLHRTIMEADFAISFDLEYQRGREKLSRTIREIIERGQTVLATDYNRAVASIGALNAALALIFEKYDAILTPATTGAAPATLEHTGSPIFCTLWTLCGTPAVTAPILQSEEGLPIGAQLVGPRGDDARLLRTARWLLNRTAE